MMGASVAKRIQVRVKFFAVYQDAYGADEQIVQLETASPVQAVLDQILAAHPELEPWRSLTRFAVNLEFAEPDRPLQDGDEVVLIPPVSGG
jgi:sulfur-carrier protein